MSSVLAAFWQKMKGDGKRGHCWGLGTRMGRQEKSTVRNKEIKIWAHEVMRMLHFY